MEPWRSQNITVSWRRSASGATMVEDTVVVDSACWVDECDSGMLRRGQWILSMAKGGWLKNVYQEDFRIWIRQVIGSTAHRKSGR